jgi:hypothetical protein
LGLVTMRTMMSMLLARGSCGIVALGSRVLALSRCRE